MSVQFDYSKELGQQGQLYATYGLFGGVPYSDIEHLNSPITPKENMIRFLRGEGYEWIPDTYSDVVDITPEINPDNIACGYEGGVDSFGVLWEALENGLPAMVRPGNPRLEDLEDWPTLSIADPDTWDWKGCAEKYKVFDRERYFRGGLPTALFERLIDVLEFENAAIALLTQPEDVEAFLTRVTDYNMKLMKHFAEDFQVDGFFMSDDWSAQLAPFFSPQTAHALLLPHLTRMVDYAHSMGKTFTLHSCGNGVSFIPLWIEAGVDAWQFQESAIDLEEAIRLADGRLKLEGYWVIPEGLNEEQSAKYQEDIMRRYGPSGQVMTAFCDASYLVAPRIRRTTYEVGRKIVNEMEGKQNDAERKLPEGLSRRETPMGSFL